jgi:hypothetical protein
MPTMAEWTAGWARVQAMATMCSFSPSSLVLLVYRDAVLPSH